MKTFPQVMAALDLSAADNTVVQYAEFITDLFDSQRLRLVHVVPEPLQLLDIGTRYISPAPLNVKIKTKVESYVEELLRKSFKQHQRRITTDIDVLQGKVYKKLLDWTTAKATDLLIIGKKKQSENSGVDANRVARHVPSAVLFVPETAKPDIQHIVVPMDYSDYSIRALKTAVTIQDKLENVQITCVFIIEILPMTYGMTAGYPPSVDRIKETIHVTQRDVLEENGLSNRNINLVCLHDGLLNVAENLAEYARENNADLILMGAKGSSPFQHFLYGSVTERMVTMERDIPVLVVR